MMKNGKNFALWQKVFALGASAKTGQLFRTDGLGQIAKFLRVHVLPDPESENSLTTTTTTAAVLTTLKFAKKDRARKCF